MCLQTVHAQIPFLNAILNFFETQSNQQPATKLLEEPNILGGNCWAGAQQASEIISETRKAAQRLGFDLDRVYTEGDRAFAFIDLTKKIRHGDIERVKDFLRGQGINTLQIESGEFMNKVFEKQLLDRLNSGKTFLGGVVEHSDYYGSVFRIVIEI